MLCSVLEPFIKKQATHFRLPVAVEEQVAVTLWRLATNVYRISNDSIIVWARNFYSMRNSEHMSCNGQKLLSKYVCMPKKDDLRMIVNEFEMRGFPQVHSRGNR